MKKKIAVYGYGSPDPFLFEPDEIVNTCGGLVPAAAIERGPTHLVLPLPDSGSDTSWRDLKKLWPSAATPVKLRQFHPTFKNGNTERVPREELASLIKAGKTSTQMAAHFGLSNRQHLDLYVAAYGLTRQRERPRDAAILKDVNFWRFVGYWLAEGCLTRARRAYAHVRLTFGATERDTLVEDALQIMGAHGYHASIEETVTSTINLDFYSRQLGGFFETFGRGAAYKKLPEWAIKLPRPFFEAMFHGYWLGDGSVSSSGNIIRVSSVSYELMRGFKRGFLRHGIVAGIARSAPTRIAQDAVVKSGDAKGRLIKGGVRHAVYEIRMHAADVPGFGVKPTMRRKSLSFIKDGNLLVRVRRVERVAC